ncbi:phosphoserine phosphatase [Fervidicoccus fontis]|uniref:Putative phosphoserine phosphatase n=1 Tax=Fervidicoccus fontis (strain DSM 19380 / JCM 18336 / VKM B-2539 / Kam940) TaxID=1163730 RepID=I0A0R6_FERFK|nr:phosphoserine phosphatase [Fervidicoccus fontis]AFH42573.1 putative phosphoserine phosphatase [Fervidicoccus fontis Kam940]
MKAFIDLDLTITSERTAFVISRSFGLEEKTRQILLSREDEYIKSIKISNLLSGIDLRGINKAVLNTKIFDCTEKLLNLLKEKGFEINIVSLAYKQPIQALFKYKLNISNVNIFAPELVVERENSKVIGVKISIGKIETPWCLNCPVCKRYIVRRNKDEFTLAIGDSIVDLCMFLEADKSILIDNGNVPCFLKNKATYAVKDLCSAIRIIENLGDKK